MKSKTLNRTLSKCALTILAALTFVGCSDYDNGFTEQQISFIKNFKETFGEVDPTQDWNLAERGKVTVTTSSPSNIKIYAKTDGKYKIVGDYEDVSGTQTLGFDVVEGTTDIMVTDGYTAQQTTVGGSVTFRSTRQVLTENDNDKVDIGKTEDYLTIKEETYSAWAEHLPEKQFNLGKVSEDFVYVSTGEFTIYPIYWDTDNYNELGVYYIGANGKPVHVPIYKIKALREGDDWIIGNDGNPVLSNGEVDTGEIQVWRYRYTWEGYPTEGMNWADAGNGKTPYDIEVDSKGKYVPKSGPEKIRAKGITVNIKPVGTVFGMYIKTKEGDLFHSNKARNKESGVIYKTDTDGNYIEGTREEDKSSRAPYAATFIDNGNMYLGFEDWTNKYNNSDLDLNDCVFMFGDEMPTVLDDGADRWVISAEDLGGTYDIDYNDVVIEVSHVSGSRYAYVTPLAAGGTLASYVYFGDTPVGSDIIDSNGNYKTGEIHELFSSANAQAISGDYSPINVKTDYTPSRRTYEIIVPRTFSLASNVLDYEPESEDEVLPGDHDMGGFHIWVLQQGEPVLTEGLSEAKIRSLQESGKIQRIRNFMFNGDGTEEDKNVPYVICTPKYWKRDGLVGHYRWPKEEMPMFSYNGFSGAAYNEPDSPTFAQWVADKNQSKDWYKYPNIGVTIAPSGIGVDPEGDIFGGDGEEGGENTPGTGKGNNYEQYGTPIQIKDYKESATWDGVTTEKDITNAFCTDDFVPTGETVTITYIAEEATWVSNEVLQGWKYGESGANSWWDYTYTISSSVKISEVINGTPNYMTVEFTISKSDYEQHKYLVYSKNTDGTLYNIVYVK